MEQPVEIPAVGEEKVLPEENMEGAAKRMFSNIPVLTLILIVLGIIKQILYYQNFHLPIKYFLGISELGLIVSDDLFYIISLILAFCIYYLVTYSASFHKKRFERLTKATEEIRSKFPNEQAFQKHIEKHIRRNNRIMFILYLIILVMSYFMFKPTNWNYASILMFFACWFFFTFYFILRRYEDNLFPNYAGLFFYLILIFCYIIFKTGLDIAYVESGKFKNTIVITDDTSYISNDTSYFIGKTEKYVFVYNTNDTSTTIIPTETIKKIKIKEATVKIFFAK